MIEAGSTTLSKKNLLILTVGGAAVFWTTTVATSPLPIAAAYRATYINWQIQTVWIDSLFAGLIIGGSLSYFLLRSLRKVPTKNPVLESARLGASP